MSRVLRGNQALVCGARDGSFGDCGDCGCFGGFQYHYEVGGRPKFLVSREDALLPQMSSQRASALCHQDRGRGVTDHHPGERILGNQLLGHWDWRGLGQPGVHPSSLPKLYTMQKNKNIDLSLCSQAKWPNNSQAVRHTIQGGFYRAT